jgi:16S rRNA (cytosine1402-N4)-methyltransferase
VSRSNFAGLQNVFRTEAPLGVQVILADLGVSSMQLDDPVRGFTFKSDGPLDMRMNPNRGASAATLLNGLDVVAFAAMLEENSDEPNAMQIARAILDANARVAIQTTLVLAEVIRVSVVARKQGGIDDVSDATRRVFQSLRIAVNDEFKVLDAFLKQIPQCLTPGGRVAILTFHSGEDRRVKNAFKFGHANGLYSSIAGEVTRASVEEQHANPRSKSAKLRFAVRS